MLFLSNGEQYKYGSAQQERNPLPAAWRGSCEWWAAVSLGAELHLQHLQMQPLAALVSISAWQWLLMDFYYSGTPLASWGWVPHQFSCVPWGVSSCSSLDLGKRMVLVLLSCWPVKGHNLVHQRCLLLAEGDWIWAKHSKIIANR